MQTDFMTKIREAESRASEIIVEAEQKARELAEQSRRDQLHKLESARGEAEFQRQEILAQAEAKLRNEFAQLSKNKIQVEIDNEAKTKAIDTLAERIVKSLGNR